MAALAKESKRLDHETEVAGKTAQDADLKTFIIELRPEHPQRLHGGGALDKQLKKAK